MLTHNFNTLTHHFSTNKASNIQLTTLKHSLAEKLKKNKGFGWICGCKYLFLAAQNVKELFADRNF